MAFDRVDHDISLQKLELYGIQDNMLEWFKDYLSNRVQYVNYNGVKSMRDIIKCEFHKDPYLGLSCFYVYQYFMSSFTILFAYLIC